MHIINRRIHVPADATYVLSKQTLKQAVLVLSDAIRFQVISNNLLRLALSARQHLKIHHLKDVQSVKVTVY